MLLGLGPSSMRSPTLARAEAAAASSGSLSAAELDDLLAFGEVLVEGSTLSPAARGFLREHIEDRVQRAGEYLALYRRAVGTLERLGGRPFARLDLPERIELVARHRLGDTRLAEDDTAGPFPRETREIRKRVAEDLIGGYYGSPAGWALVGYQTSFPGRCGDLTRYTRAEP
jgi:hypothetical protein